MKKEASGKKGKVLWLVLGIVLLVAIVTGVVLALVLGGQEQTTGGRPALYWNIDREANVDTSTGLSTRTPAEDGKYYVKFAYEGEQIELPVADKKLVNYIDSLELSSLVLDKSGVVVDVLPPQAVASEIGAALYVQSVDGDTIYANSSVAMNGRKITIKLNADATVYNVSGKGEFIGEPLDPAELNPMDTIGVYGTFVPEDSDEESVVTHVFVTNKPVESPVYWRADAYYDSTNKTTARIPDENGAYTIKWFVDGETVELKCKDEELVAGVDKADYHWPHWGLEFDEDGYIVALTNSALSSRTLLQCERFDITEWYDDGSYVATSLIEDNGSFVQGTIGPDCKIYDVSKSARAEGQVNRQLDSLRVGDRVCIWTDTTGKPVLIYVSNRIVESDIYWNVTRSYSSATQQSTRTPNADGLYEIEMLRVGDTENTIYYAKDIETATAVDSPSIRCVGLKLSEGNIIEYVYDEEALFGYTYLCNGYFLIDQVGSVCTLLSPAGSGFTRNAVLGLDCKIINVSTVGEYGAETTLRYGDSIAVFRAPNGEIIHIFVMRRLTGIDSMYYRVSRSYDSTNQVTTRTPDDDGYYVFEFFYKGQLKTLRTKSKELATKVDSSSRAEMSLEVSGDIITDIHDYSYPLGGNTAANYYVKAIDGDRIVVAKLGGEEMTETLADYCEIYNVSTSYLDHQGEKTTLKVGDYINFFRDVNYEVGLIYVRGRQTNKMAWPVDQQYNSSTASTTRTPDENGWYYVDLAVDGKVSTYKTKNKKVIDQVDYYTAAFGILTSGDEIVYTSTYSYVADSYGTGVTNYTVSSVKGSTVTAIYTLGDASKTGNTEELLLNTNVKIYDVSDPTSADYGKSVKLQVGDFIRTYTYKEDRTLTQYVYVLAHCTREGGYKSYCEHCDKVVYWNPYISSANSVRYDCHYYLATNVDHKSQMRVYGSSQDNLKIALDLNGHTLCSHNIRAVFVRYGATLDIFDSVGGGQIKSRNNTSTGGVLSVGGPEEDYGPSTLNLYSGTVTMDTDEGVTDYPYRAGLVTSNGIFNMYGGEIVGGYIRGKSSSGASAAGVQINDGEFNMYAGKIADCIAEGGSYEEAVKDADGNPVIDETTGQPKVKVTEITSYGGNLHVNGVNAVVNMYGGSIENGKAARGGNVTVAKGTFVQHGGLISGGVASAEYGMSPDDRGASSDGRGGNFFVTGTSNVYIKGGVVTGGKALDGSGMGGNFIGSSFNATIHIMDNALVTNGAAKSGSNIALMYSHLNVTGGNITNEDTSVAGISATGTTSGYSSVTISGGNIEGEINLNGGVSDNANAKYPDYRAIANISGGTIEYVNATQVQKFAVSGKPVIKNLQLAAGVLLDVGAMVDGADVTVNTTGIFTKPVTNAADYTGYFHAAVEGYLTGVSDNNELRFYNPNATSAYCEHCKKYAEWVAWDGASATAGHFYLTDNVQLTDTMNVSAVVVYDLKGFSITAAADKRTFYVDNGELNIMDTSAAKDGSVIGTSVAARGANIYINSGSFNLYSGTITGGVNTAESSDGRGGNIFAWGDVNLYGGTVSNGVALTGNGMGGNIMVTGAKLTVHEGATIIGGQAKNGLNVSLMYADLVNYGTISSNGATGNSVVVASMANRATSSFTMEAGTIDGIVNVYSGTPAEGVADFRAVVAINGGVITQLNLVDAYENTVAFSGAPVINKLTLGEGVILDVAQLTTGASIKLDSYVGVFTDVLTNANDIVGYFDTTSVAYDVIVNGDNKLEGVTTGMVDPEPEPEGTQCAHCNTNVTWTEWDGITVAAGHYYLTDNVQLTAELAVGENFVLDLKGFSITAAEGKRTFNIAANGILSILDTSDAKTGTVAGGKFAGRGANIYVNTNAVFNLYGGTVAGGICEGATSQGRGGNIFATGNVNLYGGVVKGGVALTGHGLGGNIMMTGATLTVHENATIIDGEAKNGNNVSLMYATLVNYGTISNGAVATGNSVNASSMADRATSVFTMEGGKIDGTVLINSGTPAAGVADYRTVVTVKGGEIAEMNVVDACDNIITVSGAAVINKLTLAEGIVMDAAQLTEGAAIKVNATEGILTDTLTNTNIVAYVDTVAVDRKVIVNGDNKLEIAEACACGCKTLASEIVWQDLNAYIANNGSPIYKFNADGHYYLTADLDITQYFPGGQQLTVGANTACNVVVDLNGYTYYNENRIHIYSGSSLTIMDTSAEGTGAFNIPGNVNRAGASRGFYVKGILNLRSGTIKLADNAYVSDRALIQLAASDSQFNMYGGTVTGGRADTNKTDSTINMATGGNVYVQNGTVNLYGGTISNGTATNLTDGGVEYEGKGGNIYLTDAGVLNVYGGTITGGTAAKGADVYMATSTTKGATVNVSNGVVAGEIYASGTKATVAVSGTAAIGNLNLQSDAVVTVGDLAIGAQIGITKVGDFTDVLEDAESYLPYFVSVDANYLVDVTVDNKLTLVSNNACPCGCGADKDQITWVDPAAYFNAEGSAKIVENVHLRLENDFDVDNFFGDKRTVTIGNSDTEGANVTIDLNGHTWSSAQRMYVYKLSTLTIMDSSAEQTGKMTGTGTTTNGRILISNGTVNLRSGTLTMTKEGACDCNYAGIVYIREGVFNMFGGAIVDGEALANESEGGNVYAWKGTFNMYGGIVSGGSATNGANVFIHSAGSMNFVGGTIEDYDNTVLIKE